MRVSVIFMMNLNLTSNNHKAESYGALFIHSSSVTHTIEFSDPEYRVENICARSGLNDISIISLYALCA